LQAYGRRSGTPGNQENSVLPPLGQGRAALQGPSISFDDFIEIRKDIKVAQLDGNRSREELIHRLSNLEAKYANLDTSNRSLEQRFVMQANAMLEMKNEFEMRMSELVNEVQRSRRATEQSLSSSTDAIRADVRAHDSQFRVIESTVRAAVSQMRKHEEDKSALLSEVKGVIDQRSRAIADRVNESSIASLDRALALERILDKEAEERKQQNIQIKAEIENFRSGIRQNIHAESQQRRDGEKSLRLELNESLLGLQEALQSVHENCSKICNRTSDIASDNVSRLEKEVATLNSHIESLKTTHDAAIASLHMSVKSLDEQSLIAKDHSSKSLQVIFAAIPLLLHVSDSTLISATSRTRTNACTAYPRGGRARPPKCARCIRKCRRCNGSWTAALWLWEQAEAQTVCLLRKRVCAGKKSESSNGTCRS
jgi:hypothetical protein